MLVGGCYSARLDCRVLGFCLLGFGLLDLFDVFWVFLCIEQSRATGRTSEGRPYVRLSISLGEVIRMELDGVREPARVENSPFFAFCLFARRICR